MRKGILVAALVLLTTSSVLAQSAPRAMTVDDALDMKSVGSALMSPDGNWVFYSMSELNWKENKRESKYFMIPAEGGEAFQYIGEEGGSGFQFSPDGRYLSFTRTVDKNRQIFLMRTTGGEATQLTEHETSVGSYKWSADSMKIFFSAQDKRPEEEEKALKDGFDALFVDEGPNGQTRSNWSNLWIFDLETEEEEKITDDEFILGGFDPSPDGQRIIFTARFTNKRNDRYLDEIYIVNVADKMKTRLTDNNAPEGGLLWAPDGQKFIYTAADDKEWLNRNGKIYLMDPNTREYSLISSRYEGGIRGIEWTPDSRYLLFNGAQGTNSNLFRLDVSNGNVRQVTNIEGSLSVGSFSGDKSKMVYAFSDFKTPLDIYVSSVNRFEPVRLTEANPGFEEKFLLADMSVIQWESVKDFQIEGLLHLPVGYVEGARVPLMVHIHGGPAGCFTNSFRASYHIYAGLGYASLSCNVRGSTNYSDRLMEGNTVAGGDGIGLSDFWDMMNGVDYIIAQGIVDSDRMGVRGWSYGGILGGWTISQTDRFKAASIGAGVYDWQAEYGPGFNHDVRLWHIGSTPWDNLDAWRNQSAYTHVKNVTTATLLMHCENDRTCTEAQSMSYFVAIRDIGVAPVRYIKFPRMGHGVSESHLQRVRDIEEIRWMQKHILGEEWTPWERPKAEEEKEEDEEPPGLDF